MTSVSQFGPRAQLFTNKCLTTKNSIYTTIGNMVKNDGSLEIGTFFARHWTSEGEQNLKTLDKRTNTLMLNILGDALNDLSHTDMHEPTRQLLGACAKVKGDSALGEIFKQKSYPAIKRLKSFLDAEVPHVIDEAVSGGLYPEAITGLQSFCVAYSTSDLILPNSK